LTYDASVTDVRRYLPLSPQQFHILLSLADGPRHGYGVIREVEERTDGAVRLGTGTLYTAIARFDALQLIEESSWRPAARDDDGRRTYYQLTPLGRAVLKAETARLESLVRHAHRKGLGAGSRPAWSRGK
jgi:DNA-binding PadR family transcriptional regulator